MIYLLKIHSYFLKFFFVSFFIFRFSFFSIIVIFEIYFVSAKLKHYLYIQIPPPPRSLSPNSIATPLNETRDRGSERCSELVDGTRTNVLNHYFFKQVFRAFNYNCDADNKVLL